MWFVKEAMFPDISYYCEKGGKRFLQTTKFSAICACSNIIWVYLNMSWYPIEELSSPNASFMISTFLGNSQTFAFILKLHLLYLLRLYFIMQTLIFLSLISDKMHSLCNCLKNMSISKILV
jgi:hypothetical protein